MTEQQKQKIVALRTSGMSYAAIAAETGVAPTSIKSFCQRNQLGGIRSNVGRGALVIPDACEQCGKSIKQLKGRKHKRFCSDACRMAWWSKHRDRIQRKTFHPFICSNCGDHFEVYGTRVRKFCSRECCAKYRSHTEVQHD